MVISIISYPSERCSNKEKIAIVQLDFHVGELTCFIKDKEQHKYTVNADISKEQVYVNPYVDKQKGEVGFCVNGKTIGLCFRHESFKSDYVYIL